MAIIIDNRMQARSIALGLIDPTERWEREAETRAALSSLNTLSKAERGLLMRVMVCHANEDTSSVYDALHYSHYAGPIEDGHWRNTTRVSIANAHKAFSSLMRMGLIDVVGAGPVKTDRWGHAQKRVCLSYNGNPGNSGVEVWEGGVYERGHNMSSVEITTTQAAHLVRVHGVKWADNHLCYESMDNVLVVPGPNAPEYHLPDTYSAWNRKALEGLHEQADYLDTVEIIERQQVDVDEMYAAVRGAMTDTDPRKAFDAMYDALMEFRDGCHHGLLPDDAVTPAMHARKMDGFRERVQQWNTHFKVQA